VKSRLVGKNVMCWDVGSEMRMRGMAVGSMAAR